jgi:hypothetical protein
MRQPRQRHGVKKHHPGRVVLLPCGHNIRLDGERQILPGTARFAAVPCVSSVDGWIDTLCVFFQCSSTGDFVLDAPLLYRIDDSVRFVTYPQQV